MKPMGYDDAQLPKTERGAGSAPDEHNGELVMPELKYALACIGCGITMHLQMVPHKDQDGQVVGWVQCCEKCREGIVGRRVWFGDDDARVRGPSKDWDAMLQAAELLYQAYCKSDEWNKELHDFIGAWDKMLD